MLALDGFYTMNMESEDGGARALGDAETVTTLNVALPAPISTHIEVVQTREQKRRKFIENSVQRVQFLLQAATQASPPVPTPWAVSWPPLGEARAGARPHGGSVSVNSEL